jgi:hypothetical protein
MDTMKLENGYAKRGQSRPTGWTVAGCAHVADEWGSNDIIGSNIGYAGEETSHVG